MSNRPRTRKPAPRQSRSFPVVPVLVAIAIAVLALAAVLVTVLGGDDDEGSGGATTLRQVGEVQVTGTPLPQLPDSEPDPAVGTMAPTVRGVTFDGAPVEIRPGVPTLIVFAAHWCPHCQAEIPKLSGPLRSLPSGTKAVLVSTGVRESGPNYPPSAWLEREKWPTAMMVDSADNRAATAYGLSVFPFFVYFDKDGRVVERVGGGQPADRVLARLRSLAGAA